MAYTTGTCTGHLALLAALKTFLEAHGWITKRYVADGSEYEYIAMGPGLTGADEIYIGVRTYTDASNQHYTWRLRGYTGYSSLLDFASQPGALTQTGTYGPALLLTNSTIQYWIVADTRRVIVIAKCGTSYECAYLGLILPYAPTSQLPYPLFIGGSHNRYNRPYSVQEYDHFSFFNPQSSVTTGYPCYMLCGGVWQPVVNRQNNGEGSSSTTLNLHPYCGAPYTEESVTDVTNALWWWRVRENIDGSYPLFPCRIHSGYACDTRALYGELSGVCAIPKWENLAEDIVSIDSVNYLVVQSAYRTTGRSYAAIKLV